MPAHGQLIGELVAAAVVDKRVWDAYGANASDGVYLVGQPGPRAPVRVLPGVEGADGLRERGDPADRTVGAHDPPVGPEPRRMGGAMDLTVEVDAVEDAVFDETGTYVASFMLDGEIVGEIEVPVFVQAAPAKLSEGDRGRAEEVRRDLGRHRAPSGRRRTVPAWFAYKNGKIYVLSQREPGPEEQTIPGVPDANELVIDHASEAPRHDARGVLRGAAQARGAGVGRGREDAGGQAEEPSGRARPSRSTRWRKTADIVELTPERRGLSVCLSD